MIHRTQMVGNMDWFIHSASKIVKKKKRKKAHVV